MLAVSFGVMCMQCHMSQCCFLELCWHLGTLQRNVMCIMGAALCPCAAALTGRLALVLAVSLLHLGSIFGLAVVAVSLDQL